MKRHLSASGWVAGGQVATALGTLLGVRLLTEFVEPSVFGIVSLGLGVVALLVNVTCTPIAQAALHFYPGMAARGELSALRAALFRCERQSALFAAIVLIIAAVIYGSAAGGSVVLVLLLGMLLACDCWRTINLSLMNAARNHRGYALLMAGDAWARPLIATAIVLAFGQSPTAVLASYVLAAASILLVFSARREKVEPTPEIDSTALDRRLWSYAMPLVPLGLIGWANGLGDRYLIGGLLGVTEAGVYAAAYGLASRPLLMLGGTIELFVRPIYQGAVSAADHSKANRVLLLWFAAVVGAGVASVLLIALLRDELARVFLGAQYRSGAALMPWIAGGYMLLTIAQVFERICYAHARTTRVLLIQATTAVAAAIATTGGILLWGITGAAMAVPVYFSVQVVIAAYLARRTYTQAVAPITTLEPAK